MKIVHLTALGVAALGLAACGHATPAAPTTRPAAAANPFAHTDWTTATGYHCPSDGQRVLLDKVVTGDLTGDGVPDAVVVLTCDTTTSSNPVQVAAFDGSSPDPAHPRSLGVLIAADDPAFYVRQATATIAAGTVTVTGQAIGSDEPLAADPDITLTQTFTYRGGTLVPGPRTVVHRG
jgi:hypothetical protein